MQASKALLLIVPETTAVLREIHPKKAKDEIFFTEVGIFSVVRDVHLAKAYSPMNVTVFFIVILFRALQLSNAPSIMLVIVLDRITLTLFPQHPVFCQIIEQIKGTVEVPRAVGSGVRAGVGKKVVTPIGTLMLLGADITVGLNVGE